MASITTIVEVPTDSHRCSPNSDASAGICALVTRRFFRMFKYLIDRIEVERGEIDRIDKHTVAYFHRALKVTSRL